MNKTTPQVSVIIPTFNNIEYIGASIDSVLAQSYANIEIIIIDDGSSDGTGEFISNKYKTSPNVKYFFKENNGVSSARNTGIEKSSGDLIAFLDADDLYVENKITCQVQHLVKNKKCMMVYSDMFIFNETETTNSSYHEKLNVECPSGFIFNDLLLCHLIWTGTVMLRKEVFDNIALFDENLDTAEDYDLWLRVAALHRIDYIPKVLAGYRRGHESLTSYKKHSANKYIKPNTITVIETNISRNLSLVNLAKSQINERLFDIYFEFGWSAYKSGNVKASKRYFLEALKLKKNSVKSLAYFLMTSIRGN
ncbi:MAG: glycosyltransferase [Desulfuromonadaceae bacterium]|nr:glycosyltransferase [Desulfuromonadaceae bacterium]